MTFATELEAFEKGVGVFKQPWSQELRNDKPFFGKESRIFWVSVPTKDPRLTLAKIEQLGKDVRDKINDWIFEEWDRGRVNQITPMIMVQHSEGTATCDPFDVFIRFAAKISTFPPLVPEVQENVIS